MSKSLYPIALFIFLSILAQNTRTYGQKSYLDYHRQVIKCEQLISENKFSEAVSKFDSLFSQYNFVFLRDCQVAAQLSLFEGDTMSCFKFLRLGISNGWMLKSIKKSDFFKPIRSDTQWEILESQYDSLRGQYLERLDNPLGQQVNEMFKKDQKKALGALFRIGQKAQDRYAEKKFAPHSEIQLAQLKKILDKYGYPGERLIGNNWWTSVILSHHNSISREYVLKDTLYLNLKPKLLKALERGEISPYELAQIEDWRTAVLNGHSLTSYGFIGSIPDTSTFEWVNQNRVQIGLRNIKLRNILVDVEAETGMNLYLPGGSWQKGKIIVANKQ